MIAILRAAGSRVFEGPGRGAREDRPHATERGSGAFLNACLMWAPPQARISASGPASIAICTATATFVSAPIRDVLGLRRVCAEPGERKYPGAWRILDGKLGLVQGLGGAVRRPPARRRIEAPGPGAATGGAIPLDPWDPRFRRMLYEFVSTFFGDAGL